ncbi:uncharacterized protein [Choristoneura fumiferana]|uniref:uncharacterized protein n=1 Tax=Choristoneura fumiferana TaxID=7141 RepID=UPI003D155C32
MYWLCLCVVLVVCSADEFLLHLKKLLARQARSERSNFFNTTFPALTNHHIRGQLVTEQEYPWVARVIHSLTETLPHICTASCIDERVFVTAARCIFYLKVEFTTVHYQNQILFVRAFIIPSKPTKQMFDDIGFIVVEDTPTLPYWATIKTFNAVNRTDDEFQWLDVLRWNDLHEHYVVGYAADDGRAIFQAADTVYRLTEIKIIIDLRLCSELTSMDDNDDATDFWVPCYHSCAVDTMQNDEACQPYHGVEGGAVFHKANKTLIGIATWGAIAKEGYPLPVGFSVLNSDNYYEDLKCALTIRDSKKMENNISYQSLCA